MKLLKLEKVSLGFGLGLLLLCAVRTYAGTPPVAEAQTLGSILSYGIPTNPMHQGQWVLKIVPAYLVQQNRSDPFNPVDMKGWGGAAAVTYAFTDHWGLAFLGGANKISGTETADPGLKGATATNLNSIQTLNPIHGVPVGSASGSGFLGAASVVWDHWSGDEFRFPIFFGMSYMTITEQVDDTIDGIKRVADQNAIGAFIGLVPQFNIGKVRMSPYVALSVFLNNPKTQLTSYNPSTKATIAQSSFIDTNFGNNNESKYLRTAGIGFEYIPWKLQFTLNLGDVSAYTLSWIKRFGEAE